MLCTKCGKDVPEGALFCPWCGLKDPDKPRPHNPKRRGNGTGSVWKNTSTGKWTAQVTLGYDDQKRRYRTKTGFRTKKDALDALPGLAGLRCEARDMSVAAIWAAMSPKWLDSLSPGKADHYKRAYNRLKALWRADIRSLITEDWQKEIDALPGRYDPKKEAKVVVSKIYQHAMAQGWITVNMAEYIKLPGQNESKKDSFTADELKALWKDWESGYTWTAYILIMCYVGLRPGELRKIKLEDIHLDEHYMVGGIKTEAGKRRCLAFPAFLRPVLEQAVERATRGKLLAINEQNFYEQYDKALAHAGIVRTDQRKMAPHCCRHTFISLASDSGISIATVQKMAGHSDISVTAGYYHSHDPELIQAAQRIKRPD